jgi:hypothetical protein
MKRVTVRQIQKQNALTDELGQFSILVNYLKPEETT